MSAFLELRTGSALRSIRVVNELLEVAMRELAVDEATRHDVALGVAELVANVHEHEFQGRDDGSFLLRLDLEPGQLRVTVESAGPRFEAPTYSEAAEPSFDMEAGGLGLPLLHGLFDAVRYDYVEGKGNRVTLEKKRAG